MGTSKLTPLGSHIPYPLLLTWSLMLLLPPVASTSPAGLMKQGKTRLLEIKEASRAKLLYSTRTVITQVQRTYRGSDSQQYHGTLRVLLALPFPGCLARLVLIRLLVLPYHFLYNYLARYSY